MGRKCETWWESWMCGKWFGGVPMVRRIVKRETTKVCGLGKTDKDLGKIRLEETETGKMRTS